EVRLQERRATIIEPARTIAPPSASSVTIARPFANRLASAVAAARLRLKLLKNQRIGRLQSRRPASLRAFGGGPAWSYLCRVSLSHKFRGRRYGTSCLE